MARLSRSQPEKPRGFRIKALFTFGPGPAGPRYGMAALISALHMVWLLSTVYTPETAWLYLLAQTSLAAVAIATLRGQLSVWYRWAAVIAVSNLVYVLWFPLVMVVGNAWVLHLAVTGPGAGWRNWVKALATKLNHRRRPA